MQSKTATRAHPAILSKAGQLGPATAKSDDHLYLQIASTLKQEILDGVYPVGSRLPTEDQLCERFSVSRYTVREAMRRLREDNLVASRQRAGTIVVPRHSPGSYAQDVMSINELLSWAAGRRFEVGSIEMILIDEKLAAWTGLPFGEQWLAVRGFGYLAGEDCPNCWAEYFINREFAAVGRLLPRHSGPIFPLIEDLFGQSIVEIRQEVEATLISSALARSLGVGKGTAALQVRRVFKTSDGKIAQVTVTTHPSAQYRLSMTMRRVES
jgi:GntR family transcriptional regulator